MQYEYKRYQLAKIPIVNSNNGTLDCEILFFVGIINDTFGIEAQESASLQLPLSLTFLQMNEQIKAFCINFINEKYNS